MMFRNYLLIALRSFKKHLLYSVINIFGLVLGMAASVMILHYVQFEKSFDSFQKNQHIYRVVSDKYQQEELTYQNTMTAPALGPTISQQIPGVADYFRLTSWADSYTFLIDQEAGGKNSFKEEGAIFADPAFVQYFDLKLIQAANDTLLNKPGSIMLDKSTAERYFGQDWRQKDILNQTIEVYNSNQDTPLVFSIDGIFQDMPENSHLQYHILFSHETLPEFLPKEMPEEQRLGMFDHSWGPNAWYTYVALEPSANHHQIAGQITEMMESQNQDEAVREDFQLQPIADIHVKSHRLNEPTPSVEASQLRTLSLIALGILFIAWINYINLATARANERAHEVGVKKVFGAFKKQLIAQFMLEAVIMNLIALLFAVLTIQLSSPFFRQVTGTSLQLWSVNAWNIWVILLSVFITGTLLTGLYPSYVLSSFKTTNIIKGNLSTPWINVILRKGMVVFQFAVSLALIIGTLAIILQVWFMKNQDLGVQIDRTIVVESANVMNQTTDFNQTVEELRQKLIENPAIKNVTATSAIPGRENTLHRNMIRVGQQNAGMKEVDEVLVDPQYTRAVGMNLSAGRSFSENAGQNQGKVMLNEAAATIFGFSSPEEAIQAKVGIEGYNGLSEYEIIGVVQNFHQRSLQHQFQPLAFFNEMYGGNYVIQLGPQADIASTLSFIENQWQKILPDNPFNYYFLDDFYNRQYRAERKFEQLFKYFTFIAIFIACLGLLGLATYSAQQRTKEIGIRKVLGASVGGILLLLSKDYLKLIGIAFIMAIPVTNYFVKDWLQGFAYRIDLSWWIFALPGLLVVVLALLTISRQSIKAASQNPTASLRDE